MYKEASGIREKSVSSDGWGIACRNEHRDLGGGDQWGGGGYCCSLYYFLFSCVSLDFLWTMCLGACGGSDSRFSECEQVPWSDCDKVYARRCYDQIMMFICAGTMIRLWWSLCMLVPWSDCDKVCVCRYHDHIVMRFTCTCAMIRFWWGLFVTVPWSDYNKCYVYRYHDQLVIRFWCTGAMIRLWQGLCVLVPQSGCDEVYMCRYKDRFGVEVGKTSVLVYAGAMTGRKWVTWIVQPVLTPCCHSGKVPHPILKGKNVWSWNLC